MKMKILRGLAVFLMMEIGLTHLFTTAHAFEESWIEGLLFVANFVGAVMATYGIYRDNTWGWILGFFVAGGAMVAYVWSRTTGLPGLPPEEWLDPWGTTAMITEGLFCILAVLWTLWRKQFDESAPVKTSKSWRYTLTFISLLALIAINFSVFRLDALYPELDHAHVFFLWQVRLQPELTLDKFEEEYGLQVLQVNVYSNNSIVAVRMRVLDPEKAEPMIEEGHFALLVENNTLIPAPHVSRHMLVNRIITVMFPNQKGIVKNGTSASLVFENLRVEPIIVK